MQTGSAFTHVEQQNWDGMLLANIPIRYLFPDDLNIWSLVLSIAVRTRGSDNVLVVQAASSKRSKRPQVHGIICKPPYPLNVDEVLER